MDQKKIQVLMRLRARMFLTDIKLKDVALHMGRDQSLISHVLSGRKTSRPVIDAILNILNHSSKKATYFNNHKKSFKEKRGKYAAQIGGFKARGNGEKGRAN